MDSAPWSKEYVFLLLIKSQFTTNTQNIFHLNRWVNRVMCCTLKTVCSYICMKLLLLYLIWGTHSWGLFKHSRHPLQVYITSISYLSSLVPMKPRAWQLSHQRECLQARWLVSNFRHRHSSGRLKPKSAKFGIVPWHPSLFTVGFHMSNRYKLWPG
jgi:hypothetical protein